MITSSSFLISSPSLAGCPSKDVPEFAFIGRSNVGKSTLINSITKRKELAKVSDKPGKTQLINYFDIKNKSPEGGSFSRRLVDLPGYGYAKVSKEKRCAREDMIVEFLTERGLDMIFVLIDISIPPQQIDFEFLSRLDTQGIAFQLVFTKSDKLNQKELYNNQKLLLSALIEQVTTIPDYYVTSKEKKFSTEKIVGYIESIVLRQKMTH